MEDLACGHQLSVAGLLPGGLHLRLPLRGLRVLRHSPAALVPADSRRVGLHLAAGSRVYVGRRVRFLRGDDPAMPRAGRSRLQPAAGRARGPVRARGPAGRGVRGQQVAHLLEFRPLGRVRVPAGRHRAEVQREHPPVLQRQRSVPGHELHRGERRGLP